MYTSAKQGYLEVPASCLWQISLLYQNKLEKKKTTNLFIEQKFQCLMLFYFSYH